MGFLDNFRSKQPEPPRDELPSEELPGSSTSGTGGAPIPAQAAELPSGESSYNPYKGLQLALDTRGSGAQ